MASDAQKLFPFQVIHPRPSTLWKMTQRSCDFVPCKMRATI